MTITRQDAWSNENDLLLAETVLRHIREGSTQLNAFEEVGDMLNRTSAACGFRWNAVVRNDYYEAIELAKKQRKQLKRKHLHWAPKQKRAMTTKHKPLDYIQDMMALLESLNQQLHSTELSSELTEKNRQLTKENNLLNKQLKQTRKRLNTVESDYQAFIQIMDRARKLSLLDASEQVKQPMFKMDRNGNLEQFAK